LRQFQQLRIREASMAADVCNKNYRRNITHSNIKKRPDRLTLIRWCEAKLCGRNRGEEEKRDKPVYLYLYL